MEEKNEEDVFGVSGLLTALFKKTPNHRSILKAVFNNLGAIKEHWTAPIVP
ncbi:MAG: hypothetical protein WBV93_09830 [Anaerobacillus sp.]